MSVLNILNMLHNLSFFSSKCRLFHNATLFGSCITHIFSKVALWNKRHFEEKKRRLYSMFKIIQYGYLLKKYLKCNVWR
jgi:hypothetical protein